ncbi:MAG: S-layer homology domain-containing protein [Anaerolineales bacterium]|uniref:S-layer homology domain-containing protein n=1 Tax=Candidatus Villigracilis proximus TaxID=3140683 RepID=UPI0031350620|nr:S-layer homology domain-containing protein [Anaerolineales bacterium]
MYSLLVNGGDLYVGGNFTDVVNNTLAIPEADYLAKWDGVNWSALGSNGAGSGALTNSVYALAMTGNQLYAGGIFTNANSNAADYIAKWDGVNWSALGNNGAGNGSLQGSIYDPGVYALGISSANLYTGGNFYNVNNNGSVLSTADYIAAYGLDVTPPAVQTITRVNPTPTALTSADFTVTFSESVTGVDLSDFTLTTSGVSNVTVSGISGTGSVYTVTVNTGSGNGTIRLDVMNDNSIKDAVLNPLSASFTSGQTYTVSKSPVFADVPFSYWANSYIERLYSAGITGGCSIVPLNYCPDSTVTRAQMAIFLLKGVHGSGFTPPAVGATTGFNDVAIDYWAAAWIKQLAAEGITSGCGGNNYCPDATVTRAQMAIFLLKAKNGSSICSAVGVRDRFQRCCNELLGSSIDQTIGGRWHYRRLWKR